MRNIRRGLTLLELVVVLLILAALGGLVLPVVGVYQDQASSAVSAATMPQVSQLVEQFSLTGLQRHPNGLDSLIVPPSKIYGRLASTDGLQVLELDPNQVSSLASSGIQFVFDMNPDGDASATFEANATRPGFDRGRWLDRGSPVAQVSSRVVRAQLGVVPSETGGVANIFIALGLGDKNQMIGRSIQEAPFFSPRRGNPNTVYSRYLLIFEIPPTGASGGETNFRGTMIMSHEGLRGQNSVAEDYFRVR